MEQTVEQIKSQLQGWIDEVYEGWQNNQGPGFTEVENRDSMLYNLVRKLEGITGVKHDPFASEKKRVQDMTMEEYIEKLEFS